MTLLHTQYYCTECGVSFKKADAKEHKYATQHEILKKIIYPQPLTEDIVIKEIVTEKRLLRDVIDFCIDCSKEVFAPSLHKGQGHMVLRQKAV